MNRSWYVIANPRAGNGRFEQRWPALQRNIATVLPVEEFVLTRERGHATALAKEAVEMGHRHLLAVGGDGTNHEVANGILQQQTVAPPAVTHALLPVGTGNDWIKTYRFPRTTEDCLKIIAAGRTRLQDVGHVRYHFQGQEAERYFVNVAGLAYDGYVVQRSQQAGGNGGTLHYLGLVTRCLLEYELREAVVQANGREFRDHFYTINFGIGRYSGGGMQLVPHARPDVGKFAVTLAGRLSRLSVLLNTYRFYNGSIGQHPKVQTFLADSGSVEAAKGALPTLVEADGEFLGQTPAYFKILPAALRVVVP